MSGSFQAGQSHRLYCINFQQNSTMKKSSLFSLFLRLFCVVTFDLKINTLGDTGQGNGEKKFDKLYWIREYNPSIGAINVKHYKMDYEQQIENLTGNWRTFQEVMKEIQRLKKRVNYLETSNNSTQITTDLTFLQTQVRHLTVAMISVQVG